MGRFSAYYDGARAPVLHVQVIKIKEEDQYLGEEVAKESSPARGRFLNSVSRLSCHVTESVFVRNSRRTGLSPLGMKFSTAESVSIWDSSYPTTNNLRSSLNFT